MNIAERQKCAEHFYNKAKNLLCSFPPETTIQMAWVESASYLDTLCLWSGLWYKKTFTALLEPIAACCIYIAKQSGLADIDPFIDNALATMACKGQDYAVEDNAYRDFEDTAEALGITVPQVILVHMRKHWAALCNYRDGKVIHGDPIVTKFMDMCNYCAILDAWLREQAAKEACDELTQ